MIFMRDDLYKEIVRKIVKEKLNKIEELTGEIDHNDLIYYFKNNTARNDFNDFENGVELLNKIKSGAKKLEDVKEIQSIFKSNLNKISNGRFKSEEEKSALRKIKLLYKSRQAAIKLFNDYSLIISDTKHKTKYGERLKILTPKLMLQRLPAAPAKVKAGNTSENLLNEIRQIIYFLYRARDYEKVYNNIMNSIKL